MCNSMTFHYQFNFSQKCLHLSASTYKQKLICKSSVICILLILKQKDYLLLWQSFSSACTFWTSSHKKKKWLPDVLESQLSKYLTSHSRFIARILASSYSMHRHFPCLININIISISKSLALSMHSAHRAICTNYMHSYWRHLRSYQASWKPFYWCTAISFLVDAQFPGVFPQRCRSL